jgi:murein L,D-transpeptidase YcbB/YkuD
LFAIFVLAVASVTGASAEEVDSAPAAVRRRLDSAEPVLPPAQTTQREREELRAIYERRRFNLLWRHEAEVSRQAAALLRVLRSADAYGLRPADYASARLDELAAHRDSPPEQVARFDLMLSAAAIRFVTHLHFGRVDPRAGGFHLPESRPALDAAAILDRLATTEHIDAVLDTLEPPFLHYRLLEQALARYRTLAAGPDLTSLPSFAGGSVKPGDSYAGAPALRRLLIALGDLPLPDASATSDDRRLDPALVAAIQRFQRRHGLDADGAIGKATFGALTTPPARRVRQIETTLERWRWLPALTAPPIIVNIPQFRLFAFQSTDDRAASILQMPVIVGQTYVNTRTPVFVRDMKYVVFRPYWDIPANIMKREMLPAIRADPAYLDRHNFEIVRGQSDAATPVAATAENIDALAAGRLRLRQRPGGDNALGLVKFMFPNEHNVYLHSTPARQLFQQSRRAFSHGCIRVSDPAGLAAHVLQNTPGEWTPEKIEAAMNGSKTLRVNLSKPIPVMILYGTVLATEAGDVMFFEDIYGHDRKVEALLGLGTASAAPQ